MKNVELFTPEQTTKNKLPLFHSDVSCGFPSPADDYVHKSLDLNEYLIRHPSSTFLVRATGTSMIDAGIGHGDILIVDRSLEAKNGAIVLAIIDGEFTVKRLVIQANRALLHAENKHFPLNYFSSDINCLEVFGVITHNIRSHLL